MITVCYGQNECSSLPKPLELLCLWGKRFLSHKRLQAPYHIRVWYNHARHRCRILIL